MAKEFAKRFYNSKAWEACRKEYINQRIMKDGGLCERCKERTGFILHHKTELNPQNIANQDITLNYCNLEYLCKKCHDQIHFTPNRKPSLMFFDECGQPLPKENSPH